MKLARAKRVVAPGFVLLIVAAAIASVPALAKSGATSSRPKAHRAAEAGARMHVRKLSLLASPSVDLCAKTGTITLPGLGTPVPIWGFALGTCASAGAPELPGPVLEATAGDSVTVNLYVDSSFPDNVSLLFNGQDLALDWTGAAPGGMVSYTFTASNPGTYLYEAGTNSGSGSALRQVPMGLYGALIVRPLGAPSQAYDDPATAFDTEAALVLSEIDPALNNDPTGSTCPSEVQTVEITGGPTGGTFTLTFGSDTTGAIPFDATAADVQAALEALLAIGAGNVVGGGGPLPRTDVTITFQGTFAGQDVPQMTATSSLTGGTSPDVSVATARPGRPDCHLENYNPTYWLINGKAYPDTAPITVSSESTLGHQPKVLFRYVDAGIEHHTMTMLGMHQRIFAKDGYPLNFPYDVVAETIAAGQTVDTIATIPSGAAPGDKFPVYSRNLHLTNGDLSNPSHFPGGMLTFLTVGP